MCRSCTVWPVQLDSRNLFARRARRRSSRRQPLRLGPRSLDPDRSFWSACAELIRGRIPPIDFCNYVSITTCGQPNRGPLILAGTETAISFLFLRAELSPLRERGHAASRATSVRSDLGVGSSRLPEFAQPRCRLERATFADSRRTKCSDDRRARVCGPSEGRHLLDREWLIALDLECMRFVWRMPMPFPSSGTTGHPLSPARPSAWEEALTDCRPPA